MEALQTNQSVDPGHCQKLMQSLREHCKIYQHLGSKDCCSFGLTFLVEFVVVQASVDALQKPTKPTLDRYLDEMKEIRRGRPQRNEKIDYWRMIHAATEREKWARDFIEHDSVGRILGVGCVAS